MTDINVGTFTKRVTGTSGVQQVIDIPFDPKALMIWGTSAVDMSMSIGFSDGIHHRVICGQNESGVAMTIARQTVRDDALITFIDASGLIRSRASVVFDNKKFILTWDIQDNIPTALNYLAVGGKDIQGVNVNHFVKTLTPGRVTQQIVTSPNTRNIKRNKGVAFFLANKNTSLNTVISDMNIGIGVSTDIGRQTFIHLSEASGSPSSTIKQQWREQNCYGYHNAIDGTDETRGFFDGFRPHGFDIIFNPNLLEANIIPYMIIRGGLWEVGTTTTPTASGIQTIPTTLASDPKSIFTLMSRQISPGISEEDASMCLGTADGTNHAAGGLHFESQSPSTSGFVWSSDSKINQTVQEQSGIFDFTTEASLNSLDPSGFTLAYNKANTAYQFGWLAIASAEPTSLDGMDIIARELRNSIGGSAENWNKTGQGIRHHTRVGKDTAKTARQIPNKSADREEEILLERIRTDEMNRAVSIEEGENLLTQGQINSLITRLRNKIAQEFTNEQAE
jgi:hypothetical protein